MCMTWEQIKNAKPCKIFHDEFSEGVRFIILRGPTSLCAYLGVPKDHPLADHGYDNIPIDCHGGLTFSSEGNGSPWPEGFFWYGWDYSHGGDCSFHDEKFSFGHGKKWLVKDVIEDSWGAIQDFKKLVRLAEAIRGKKK